MESLRPVIGIFKTVVPIVYCGALLYYFIGYSGSLEDAQTLGLSPFLIGLASVGLIFSIILVFKLAMIVLALRTPRPGERKQGGASPSDTSFDADAVVARYLARQGDGGVPRPPLPTAAPKPAAPQYGGPPKSSFGRRTH
ncbi:MAG: hypothetical protein P4L57_14835 [Rhizomicrobium sp.]|nr:hypothetical protein [Rhizomicrobium sp.]